MEKNKAITFLKTGTFKHKFSLFSNSLLGGRGDVIMLVSSSILLFQLCKFCSSKYSLFILCWAFMQPLEISHFIFYQQVGEALDLEPDLCKRIIIGIPALFNITQSQK